MARPAIRNVLLGLLVALALPLANGKQLPVLYFNRNPIIDRILAANALAPVAVF